MAPRWRRGGPRLAAAIALGATGLERSRSPAFGEKRLCCALARKLSMSMFDLFAIPLLTEGPTLTPPLLLRGSAVVATSCLHPRSSHTERTFSTWARSRLSPRLPLCADLQSPIFVSCLILIAQARQRHCRAAAASRQPFRQALPMCCIVHDSRLRSQFGGALLSRLSCPQNVRASPLGLSALFTTRGYRYTSCRHSFFAPLVGPRNPS